MLSATDSLWAIFLTQGVMAGAGVGTVFVAVSLQPTRTPGLSQSKLTGLHRCIQRIPSRRCTSRSSPCSHLVGSGSRWCEIMILPHWQKLILAPEHHHRLISSHQTYWIMARPYRRFLLPLTIPGLGHPYACAKGEEETRIPTPSA